MPRIHLLSYATYADPRLQEDIVDYFKSLRAAGYASVNLTTEVAGLLDPSEDHRPTALEHEASHLPLNLGWLSLGAQVIKPRLIRRWLQLLPQGDFLFYHDSNLRRYPRYQSNLSTPPRFLARRMERHSLCLFSNGYKPRRLDVKRYALQKHGLDGWFSSFANGIWAGALLLRVDAHARGLIDRWLTTCADPDSLLPWPDVQPEMRYPQFQIHTCDQACLTLVSAQFASSQRVLRVNASPQRQLPDGPWSYWLLQAQLLLSFGKFWCLWPLRQLRAALKTAQ